MSHTSRHLAVALGCLGLVGVTLAGCSNENGIGGGQSGLTLRSAIGNTCVDEGGSLTFDIDIREQGSDESIASATGVDLSQVFDAGDLDLVGVEGEDIQGIWVGGDEFFPLPPGTYEVTATANQGDSTIELLPSASQTHTVTVTEGQTAETVFTYQCEGQTLSALDVVVLVNEGPSIVDWQYGPDKFAMQCETTALTATFSDLQGGLMTVTYELYDEPLDNDPETTQSPVDTHVETVDAPVAGGEFSTTWELSYGGAPGTYYAYVEITNSATPPQSTRFQAPVHIYDALHGYAAQGDQAWGYNSCEPGDRVELDAECAALLGGEEGLPKPDEVCNPIDAWEAAHPECEGVDMGWIAPGQYTYSANPSGRDPNLPGSTYNVAGCVVAASYLCNLPFDPVWDVTGRQWSDKCNAQWNCATYSTNSCGSNGN